MQVLLKLSRRNGAQPERLDSQAETLPSSELCNCEIELLPAFQIRKSKRRTGSRVMGFHALQIHAVGFVASRKMLTDCGLESPCL